MIRCVAGLWAGEAEHITPLPGVLCRLPHFNLSHYITMSTPRGSAGNSGNEEVTANTVAFVGTTSRFAHNSLALSLEVVDPLTGDRAP